jgi:hypothetical protein
MKRGGMAEAWRISMAMIGGVEEAAGRDSTLHSTAKESIIEHSLHSYQRLSYLSAFKAGRVGLL